MERLQTPPLLADPVRCETLENGQVWSLTLDTPKANILDAAKVRALTSFFQAAEHAPAVKAILITGAGAHFSFGASVEEHLPQHVAGMLSNFHGLFRAMLTCAVPTLAAVRGQCLGGALELASFCTRVLAAPDAVLGQPEICLGVFAPVASFFLPERIGRPAAEALCLSGRSVSAREGLALGLVDEIAADPREAALAWVRCNLLPHSAASLRRAQRALRAGLAERFHCEIERLERLYLDDLMSTYDAREGLQAFLEKRPPVWRNA
jgi:cyclohexa-1,5-dienecarbonyl-CoA hydratase